MKRQWTSDARYRSSPDRPVTTERNGGLSSRSLQTCHSVIVRLSQGKPDGLLLGAGNGRLNGWEGSIYLSEWRYFMLSSAGYKPADHLV